MQIGTLRTDNFTVLAPLAGITNLPMRLLAKRAGCGLVCSEMISSNGLVYNSGRTRQLLDSVPEEKPLSVQLFGSDPGIMADAAAMVAAAGADILDINFGCSVRKILKSNSGSALMKDPDLARRILQAVRAAVTIPLTVKIRSGWDSSGDQALTIARLAEACGVDAIAVHPRTATQGFGGTADWRIIARIKKCLAIPVIGNGDVKTADDAIRMRRETGCDGVMVGRAAIGNPFIFAQILAVDQGRQAALPDDSQRIAMMIDFLNASVRYIGEDTACRMMRSRLSWFVKGMRHAGQFRNSIRFIASQAEATALIRQYAESIGVSAVP
jgi:tRNA-dihydrouridine synthase B